MERSHELVRRVAKQIVELVHPSRIIEYNTKYDMNGEVSAFKLCIVGAIPDKKRLLSLIFDQVDSEVPFDVLLYTDEQFAQLQEEEAAFANRVHRKGRVLYER